MAQEYIRQNIQGVNKKTTCKQRGDPELSLYTATGAAAEPHFDESTLERRRLISIANM